MKTKLFAVVGMLALLLGLLPSAAYAAPLAVQVVTPVVGTLPPVYLKAVNDGPNRTSDPHVSGDWVSYTDMTDYGVRFQNLDLDSASDRLIPRSDSYDYLSDISGNTITFARYQSGDNTRIYVTHIDAFGNPELAVEVSPIADSIPLRTHAVIGGDTIAYQDRTYFGSASAKAEISLSSAANPSAPAYRLTNDLLDDRMPAVSADGNAVVWMKCIDENTTETCDIWRAERTDGVWGAPEQVTDSETIETYPDTNGPVTVFATYALGGYNIGWAVKDESGAYVESVLVTPGLKQLAPKISGNNILFMGRTDTRNDIWLYNLATNRLYQLTDNSDYEYLMSISSGPGGLVRVVWDQRKMIYPNDEDIYALSFFLDTTAPVITSEIQGTLGTNSWYTGDVTLSWTVTDAQSAFTTSGCDPLSITSDQAATGYTCSADSDGGASSQTVPIARDATKPVSAVTGVSEGASYELGSVPLAGCASSDNLSGMAAEAALALTGGDAQGVGDITATCSGALDAAGNPADPAVVHFTVTNPVPGSYSFRGFFEPVDNPGQGPAFIFNSVKAGSAVPVKFSLTGDQGLDIFAPGYPLSKPASCSSAELTNPIEETVAAGGSGLSYDALSDIYTYVWKTDKKWAGSCRALNVTLSDGSQHLAYFTFK